MNRVPVWLNAVLVLVLVVGLTACKSRPQDNGCIDCPPVVSEPPTVIAQPTYPPPAPSYPAAPLIEMADGPAQADLDAANDRADLERARSADLERQLRIEQDRVANAEGRLRSMESELTAPPAGPAPEVEGAPDAGVSTLAKDLRARSTADVVQDGDMVIVRVIDGFRPGQDLLKRDLQLIQTLNVTADALSRYPGATVSVVGHSDTDPIRKSKWASNDELSMARAQRVAKVLADNGVDLNRISVDGRGARDPLIVPERSNSDKARNRRVEIMIRP